MKHFDLESLPQEKVNLGGLYLQRRFYSFYLTNAMGKPEVVNTVADLGTALHTADSRRQKKKREKKVPLSIMYNYSHTKCDEANI